MAQVNLSSDAKLAGSSYWACSPARSSARKPDLKQLPRKCYLVIIPRAIHGDYGNLHHLEETDRRPARRTKHAAIIIIDCAGTSPCSLAQIVVYILLTSTLTRIICFMGDSRRGSSSQYWCFTHGPLTEPCMYVQTPM
jgi:hypothetical protein